ncbi:MAG: LysM peptidoglycan-binding domain-containing protein [Planktomarina sp.]
MMSTQDTRQQTKGLETVHRPLIILISFVGIGLALFFFQPGVDAPDAPNEIASIDDASTFAPAPDVFEPAPELVADVTPSAIDPDADQLVLSSDVFVQVQEAPASMPMPTGLDVAMVSSIMVAPDVADEIAMIDTTVADTINQMTAPIEPEVTRAEAPVLAASSPSIDFAPEVQLTQPMVSSDDETSGFFNAMGDRPLLLTATIGGAAPRTAPSNASLATSTALTAPASLAVTVSAPRPSVAATLAPTSTETTASVISFLDAGALAAPAAAEVTTVAAVAVPNEFIATHVVRSGDSLSKMAIRYYGVKEGFVHIFAANRDILRRPEQIRVGQRIRIPLVPAYQ